MNRLFASRKQQLLAYFRQHHHLPSYDELAQIFGVASKGSLHKYLQKFINENLLLKGSGGKLIPTPKLYGLRLLGGVQAGFPTEAEEQHGNALSLDEYLIDHPDASYLLTVSGDSMIDAGILAGDMVIVDRGRAPKSGDIVVARVDDGWTVKYFMKKGSQIFLRAANKHYPDIYPKQELAIGGVVTSVIRKYK